MCSSPTNLIRLFAGVPITPNISHFVQKVQHQNARQTSLRWVPLENLHLTSIFIGEVSPLLCENIVGVLNIIAKKTTPFLLTPTEIKIMPPRNPRMIWLKFNPHDAYKNFLDLHQQYFAPLNLMMRQFDTYRPHITLARFKENMPPENFTFTKVPATLTFDATKLCLWEAKLQKSGATYTLLHEFVFPTTNK
ncbi:MAG: RNA 2',3'-cyclic phosphodiesterase [Chitinophagales bacterium]|nr:RNA 2',3'-cyclic phosphodiesterase [Bacteroidota bacterium]MCB9043387.1 RNA 2',3'-cyclic phosphodiesterase [Chitinophagales bacterium]